MESSLPGDLLSAHHGLRASRGPVTAALEQLALPWSKPACAPLTTVLCCFASIPSHCAPSFPERTRRQGCTAAALEQLAPPWSKPACASFDCVALRQSFLELTSWGAILSLLSGLSCEDIINVPSQRRAIKEE
eukprot:scaffold20557_cov19-Tisochrysis_lutea.AAC.2